MYLATNSIPNRLIAARLHQLLGFLVLPYQSHSECVINLFVSLVCFIPRAALSQKDEPLPNTQQAQFRQQSGSRVGSLSRTKMSLFVN
jgi:peptidase E